MNIPLQGIFITTILDTIKSDNYRLGTVRSTIIKLPAIKINDEYEPDWDWMSKYIANKL